MEAAWLVLVRALSAVHSIFVPVQIPQRATFGREKCRCKPRVGLLVDV